MADIVTGTVSGNVDMSGVLGEAADIRTEGFEQTSDIRRDVANTSAEGRYATALGIGETRRDVMGTASDNRYANALGVADIRRELAVDTQILDSAVKSAGWANSDRTGTEADRVVASANANQSTLISQIDKQYHAAENRSFDHAKDLAKIEMAVALGRDAIQAAAERSAQVMQIAVLQNTVEGQKNTTYLSDKIGNDGDRTRALINDLKYNDLNRALIERQTELTEARFDGRHWRDRADMNQFAALSNQLQAFGSQLQDTRNGIVNLGTMTNTGQRATSNNL